MPMWGEHLYSNYKALLNNPSLLSWKGHKANARLLKTVQVVKLYSVPLWNAIENDISFPADFGRTPNLVEFGYDWRQSNVASALDMGALLSSLFRSAISKPPPRREERRVTFIMHSMGGLVVRIAIAKNILNTSWIDRLIHIGSPLYGAQSAFATLFGVPDVLPSNTASIKARAFFQREPCLREWELRSRGL
jgi:pimeloyl-ACP methyl ester carboxylesterase